MKIVRRLRAIGPRPVLLARYVAHQLAGRAQEKWLRRSYDDRMAHVPDASLVLPPIAIPRLAELPAALRADAERIVREADAAQRHEFDVLGSGFTPLGESIDWHVDYKSGYRWPTAFYLDVEVTRLSDTSDAKVPWELCRGHHLLTLARAACLTGDDRYVVELESQLESWITSNPAGRGINWTNPMEVAIRAVNWVWAIATVEQCRPLDPVIRKQVVRSLQVHGRHIRANLEGSPWLRSNHYLADVLGLVVLGAAVADDPAARAWLADGRRAFEREIGTQVHDDGLAFEASLPYHALVLEMFLIARYVCAWARQPLSAVYDERLRRMLAATRAIRHPDGRLPQIGDCDSGRILPGGVARPPTADHLLWLGAAILGDDIPDAGRPEPEVAWTLGLGTWSTVGERPSAEPPTRRAFPHGGIYVLEARGMHVVVRCGDVGQNGNGGHAHNDPMSFELSVEGRAMVVDSGTYTYTADPAARNSFRATAAHSTLVVADAEIHPIAAERLFELAQFADVSVESFVESSDAVRLVASHDGYRRLAPPVVHRRTFALERVGGTLTVSDELIGNGRQEARSLLHLSPGTSVSAAGQDRYDLELDGTRLMLSFVGADHVDVDEGWVSDRFGVRARALVLSANVSGELPVSIAYRFERVEER